MWSFVLFFGVLVFTLPEYCDEFESMKPRSHSEVRECLDEPVFDESVRNQTLESLFDLLEMYIYRDTAMKPNPPFNKIQVDLRADLENIKTKEYTKDYEFQVDVQNVYAQLKDAHTRYIPPFCYSHYAISLPFLGTSRLVEDEDTKVKEQRVFLKKHISEFVRSNYSFVYPEKENLVHSYVDWEILEINGVPGFQYLLDYADNNVSFSRDLSTRFNFALTEFFFTKALIRPFPENSSVEFTLKNPYTGDTETVDVPYIIYPMLGTKKQGGFMKTCGYYLLKSVANDDDDDDEDDDDENGSILCKTRTKECEWVGKLFHPYPFDEESDGEFIASLNFFDRLSRQMVVHDMMDKSQFFGSLTLPLIDSKINEYFVSYGKSPEQLPMEISFDDIMDNVAKKFPHLLATNDNDDDDEVNGRRKAGGGADFLEKEEFFEEIANKLGITTFVRKRMNDSTITGIIRLSNFYPEQANVIGWVGQLFGSLHAFDKLKVSRLVIDLRGNGGGFLCLPWYLVQLLSPYAPKNFYVPTDTFANDFFKKTYCPAQSYVEFFGMLDKKGEVVDHTMWHDPVGRMRGGSFSNYSKPLALDCHLFNFMFIHGFKDDKGKKVDFFTAPIKFEPDQLVLLTDGTCGSACGIFITTMKKLGMARVVGQGGLYHLEEGQSESSGDYLSICSFRGASVLRNSITLTGMTMMPFRFGFMIGNLFPVWQFLRTLLAVGVGMSLKFLMCMSEYPCPCPYMENLPGFQIHTFSWLEIYNFDRYSIFEYEDEYERVHGISDDSTNELLGFAKDRADARIWTWDFGKDDEDELKGVYDLTLESGFDVGCFPGEVRRSDECAVEDRVENGVYGNPCGIIVGEEEVEEREEKENFGFVEEECVLRGCLPGYYLTRDHSECREMKEESMVQMEVIGILVDASVRIRVVWISIFLCCMFAYCCSLSVCGWLLCCCADVKRRVGNSVDLMSLKESDVMSALSESDGGTSSEFMTSSSSFNPDTTEEEEEGESEESSISSERISSSTSTSSSSNF